MGIDQLAHEMALAMQSVEPITDMTLIAKLAYQYADAMEAERKKRQTVFNFEKLDEVE